MTHPITPVILSGGSGTRLWPLSRSARPKQLLSLTDELTMLQLTAMRCADPDRFGPPIIVANAAHAAQIEEQLAFVHAKPAVLILEPVARNTAPAIALAALAALDRDPEAVLLVMPSDHVIRDPEAFLAAVTAALPSVEQGWLVTFGLTPDAPETGYGYIRMGAEIENGVRETAAFVEKPDLETAQGYLADGNYVWNSGIFLFRGDAYLAQLANHAPEMAAAVRKSMDAAGKRGRLLYPEPKSFAQSPSDSIDYAVMEKSNSVAVIPVDMAWSDVGSWDALYAIAEKDEAGNVAGGDVLSIDSNNCLLKSGGPLITVIGVSDLIVVATDKAVMIMPRGTSQDVKRAVEALKQREHDAL